jgi:hypothetical protein
MRQTCSDRHQTGDADTQSVDDRRHCLRLAREVFVLALNADLNLRILHQPFVQSIEIRQPNPTWPERH